VRLLRGLSFLAYAAGAFWALAAMARADSTGRKILRGRTIASGATGGVPGSNDALGVPSPITANGQTAWFEAEDVSSIVAVLTVAGPVTGTTPTLDVVCETDDGAGGSIRSLGSFTQKTAVAAAERKSFPGADRRYRFRWTVGGTTPSFSGVTITGEAK
jgi:hypothetical protein